MKKLIVSILAVTLIIWIFVSCTKENDASLMSGQDSHEYPLGAQLLPTAEYEAIPLADAPEYELKTLPVSVILPTPPVGCQSPESSCVAWGAAYAARSIDWYKTHENTSYSNRTNIFSPEFVYNQAKIGYSCSSGTVVANALILLKGSGVCTYESMPSQLGCTLMPNATQKAEGRLYRIRSFGRVTVGVTTLKTYLASGKPIVVAGQVNSAFMNLGNGQVLQNFTGTPLGGHCYCIMGYDDTKLAFKFQNSWGTGWASQGFGWISYTYIQAWVQEAYIITTNVNP